MPLILISCSQYGLANVYGLHEKYSEMEIWKADIMK